MGLGLAVLLAIAKGGGNPNHYPAGTPGGKGGQFAPKAGIATPEAEAAFKKWFGNSKVVDDEGNPLVLYHGTTGDFDAFSQVRANPESDWGAGFYASNDHDDVESNYAGEGPDLTLKLDVVADQIQQDEEFDGDAEEARRIARDKLSVKHGGATMPIYVKMETPFTVGGKGETILDYTQDYNEESDEYGEEKGKLVDFIVALRENAAGYHDGEVDSLISSIMEEASGNEGISASRLQEIIKNDESFGYYTDDDGRLVSKEIVRQTLESVGFDGIIDRTVNEKFGTSRQRGKSMKGVDESTVHYIVFQANRIKSALGNAGTFSPTSESIIKAGGRDDQKRWPAGTPGGKGGQFAPENGGSWLDSLIGLYHDDDLDRRPKPKPAGWKPHPKTNDKGEEVAINYPSKATGPDSWTDPKQTATFTPGGDTPKELHGIDFYPWQHAPKDLKGWATVPGQNASLIDPPLVAKHEKDHLATGVIIVEKDGRVWLTAPTNRYGGYEATWPKGSMEEGLPLQANAIKESYEETGLKVSIVGTLGDVQRDTSVARMYVAIRTGGTPKDMGWESQAVHLAPVGHLHKLLNRSVDRDIAKRLEVILRDAKIVKSSGYGFAKAADDWKIGLVAQIKASKLPDSNINSSYHNAKLEKIADFAFKGDAKGLLALNFGSNNYAKKEVNFANAALLKMGSPFTVSIKQKANSHPSLSKVLSLDEAKKVEDGLNVFANKPTKSNVSMTDDELEKHELQDTIAEFKANPDPFKGNGQWDEEEHPRGPDGRFISKPKGIDPDSPQGSHIKTVDYFAAKGDLEKVKALQEKAKAEDQNNQLDPEGKWAKVEAYDAKVIAGMEAKAAKNAPPAEPAAAATSDKPSGELTKPPLDYFWFNQAYAHAKAGDMAALDQLAPTYKTQATMDAFNAYRDKLKIEMAAGGVVAPTSSGNITHDSLDAVPAPPAKASGPQTAMQAMLGAAKKGDKGMIMQAQDAALHMAEAGGPNAGEWNAAFDYGNALKKVVNDGASVSAKADQITGPTNISDWTYAAAKPGGSNPGGLYKDENGTLWLVKGNAKFVSKDVSAAMSDDRSKNEVLATKLMEAAGIPAPEMKLVQLAGKHGGAGLGKEGDLGVAVKMIEDVKPWMSTKGNVAAIQEQFAVHAWLANYDVMGLGNDNVMVSPSKGVINIDPGGAILFRAQGLPKNGFSSSAPEWESMRDPLVNASAAKVFGPMTESQLVASTMKVMAVENSTIKELVDTYGPGDAKQKAALAEKLIARKEALAGKPPKDAEFEADHPRGPDGKFAAKPGGNVPPPPPMPDHMPLTAKKLGQMHAAAVAGDMATVHDLAANNNFTAVKNYHAQLVAHATAAKESELGSTAAVANASKYGFSGTAKQIANSDKAMKAMNEAARAGNPQGVAEAFANGIPHVNGIAPDLKEHFGEENFKIVGDAYVKQHTLATQNLANIKAGLPPVQPMAAGVSVVKPPRGPKSGALKDTDSADAEPEAKPIPPGMPDFDSKKLALTNTNAASVNAKIDKIKSLAMAGDTKGLLALGYGINNYNKTNAKLANEALKALGSPYQVTPGQKPNTHPALNLTGAAAAQPTAPKEGTTKIVSVPDSALPTMTDFANFHGPGKPLSSLTHINQANQAAQEYLKQLAKNGDLDALKAATFKEIDKATGQPTGKTVSFSEHPSKYVQNYWSGAIDAVNDILHPPKPLVLGSSFLATDWAALAREATPVPALTSFSKVKDDHKFGFWFALGQSNLADGSIKDVQMSSKEVSDAKAAYQSYSPTTKKFVSGMQGGSMIGAFKSNEASWSGTSLKALATAAYNDATPLPVGKTLYRWQSMPKGMIDQLNLLQPGAVIQGTSPMPSSWHPTKTKNFGNHLIRFHAGKGAKAIHSHGSGSHYSPVEEEVSILPYQRFVLLKKQKGANGWIVDMMLLPPTKP